MRNDEWNSAFDVPVCHSAFIIPHSSFLVHPSGFPMMTPTIPEFRKRRPRSKRVTSKAPPALMLVQAVYPTDTPGSIDLKFDRAINIDAFDGSQVIVKDGLILSAYCDCSGPAELRDAQTVRLFLVNIEDYFEPNQLLDATGESGIVASDDGAAWAGVTGLGLPYP